MRAVILLIVIAAHVALFAAALWPASPKDATAHPEPRQAVAETPDDPAGSEPFTDGAPRADRGAAPTAFSAPVAVTSPADPSFLYEPSRWPDIVAAGARDPGMDEPLLALVQACSSWALTPREPPSATGDGALLRGLTPAQRDFVRLVWAADEARRQRRAAACAGNRAWVDHALTLLRGPPDPRLARGSAERTDALLERMAAGTREARFQAARELSESPDAQTNLLARATLEHLALNDPRAIEALASCAANCRAHDPARESAARWRETAAALGFRRALAEEAFRSARAGQPEQALGWRYYELSFRIAGCGEPEEALEALVLTWSAIADLEARTTPAEHAHARAFAAELEAQWGEEARRAQRCAEAPPWPVAVPGASG